MFKYFYNFIDKVKSKLTQKGQGMIEYAMIIAFVAVIAGVALSSDNGLSQAIQGAFQKAANMISNNDVNTEGTH